MKAIRARVIYVLIAAFTIALVLAACGGGGSSSSTSGGSEPSGEGTGEATNLASDSPAVEAAKEKLAPYVGHPSPFVVTEKLKEVPKGATIAYMDCGTPFCAILGELFESAGKTMGVKIETIKAGSTASSISSAFDTVVAEEPAAVLAAGENVELWKSQLKELQEKNIPVVTTGIQDVEQLGVVAPYGAEKQSAVEGELLANYIAAYMNPEANVVIYEVPELGFTATISEALQKELSAICPKCSVRTAKIGIEEIGNTAPDTIVSDLQANPETNLAVFTSAEMATGLPAALTGAGIEIETIGNDSTPTNLQYMKEGKETVGFASDIGVVAWGMVDQAARGIIGQKLTGLEAEGASVKQFLTKKDITFDPTKGWTGYPEFPERFEKLWGVH